MCPAGYEPQDRVCAPTTEYLCATSKRWIYDESDDSCVIKVQIPDEAVSDKCYMSGALSPQCATVFGSNEDIFGYDGFAGVDYPLIYNCDPGGTSGLIPATINTIGAAACKCPFKQELNDSGVCAPIQCAEGQKLFVDEMLSQQHAGCYDAEIVDIAEDCRAKDWDSRAVGYPVKLVCDIPFTRYFASGRESHQDESCVINPEEPYTAVNICRDIFGNPPQFPTATGDPVEDAKRYVSHCNQEGTVPGGIPETVNTVGAKECGCDGDFGYVGDWPNCAGPEYEVVYSYFPPSLSVNVGRFAITPLSPGRFLHHAGLAVD